MYRMMTPGPTMVAENVRMARSEEVLCATIDSNFMKEYTNLCQELGGYMHASGEVYILDGEGILSLEAACATMTEPGDRVLVLDNGVYGGGFADFVEIYQGEPVLYTVDYQSEIDVHNLECYLEKNHDFKYAAVVHCDTPSGVRNDLSKIGPLLKKYGILTVVDSVSATFGEPIDVDAWGLDVVCVGSQKALSAPSGLTFVTISNEAMKVMESRRTRVASFYCNLLIFKDYEKIGKFPYTMPASDIRGLREAFENVKADKNIIMRHEKIAEAVRYALQEGGLSLYLKNGFANTVTAVEVPQGLNVNDIIQRVLKEYNILIGSSIGQMKGKVFRIGHMGENANEKDVCDTLKALTHVLRTMGVTIRKDMDRSFTNFLSHDIL